MERRFYSKHLVLLAVRSEAIKNVLDFLAS